jgi:hypothetical protein
LRGAGEVCEQAKVLASSCTSDPTSDARRSPHDLLCSPRGTMRTAELSKDPRCRRLSSRVFVEWEIASRQVCGSGASQNGKRQAGLTLTTLIE